MDYITYIYRKNDIVEESFTTEANDLRNVDRIEDKFLDKIKELGVSDDEETHMYLDEGFFEEGGHFVELIHSESLGDD